MLPDFLKVWCSILYCKLRSDINQNCS